MFRESMGSSKGLCLNNSKLSTAYKNKKIILS